jgi:hypothetical protein
MPEETPIPGQINLERADDFAFFYANHVWYQSSVWDLKLLFGEVDQSKSNTVVQHTGITLSWLQVKLMIYFLQVNLAFNELQNGKVSIPPSVMPPVPELVPPESADDQEAQTHHQKVMELREQLING